MVTGAEFVEGGSDRAHLSSRLRRVLLRAAEVDDHARVLWVADLWWGRPVAERLAHRLFFEHFADTSVIAEDGDQLLGFLIGVLSQTRVDEAYIHMVAVHPEHRAAGLARTLYERFFALARERNRSVVSATTSPENHGSIAFHAALGFSTSVETDRDTGRSRVVFRRGLQPGPGRPATSAPTI